MFLNLAEEIEPLFKSREIAAFIWILLFIIIFLFSKDIRGSLISVIKAFFAWKIQFIIIISALYTTCIIYLLYKTGFWNFAMLKDCLLWFTFSALAILFGLNKASSDKKFFKKLLIGNFKLTVVYQFIVNTHSFGLITELILVPVLILIAILSFYSETKKEYQSIGLIINSILFLIGIAFFTFALVDIFNDLNKFASYKTLKSFLLPIVLTISFIPNAYIIALIMAYETLFTRIKFFVEGKTERRYTKWTILKKCNISLNSIGIISPKVNHLHRGMTKEEIKKTLATT